MKIKEMCVGILVITLGMAYPYIQIAQMADGDIKHLAYMALYFWGVCIAIKLFEKE